MGRPLAINPDVPVFKRLRAWGLRRCYACQPRREREGQRHTSETAERFNRIAQGEVTSSDAP